jgi:hypothetical protein
MSQLFGRGETIIPIPQRVYEGTIEKIRQLEAALLTATVRIDNLEKGICDIVLHGIREERERVAEKVLGRRPFWQGRAEQ